MTQFEILNYILVNAGGSEFDGMFVLQHATNLLILLAIIYYFAKKPVMNFLASRRANLSREIDEAQETIKEAKAKYEEYTKKLEGIEAEIHGLKDTIKKQGEIERDEVLKQANHSAELLSREARDTIELEAERAKHEIQKEVVQLAIDIAQNLIKQNLGEAEKEKLLSEFTKNIEEEKWHQSRH